MGLVKLGGATEIDETSPPTFRAAGGTQGLRFFHLARENKLNFGFSIQLSGSAIDHVNHLALFMAGFSEDLAVARLDDPTSPSWKGLSDWRYFTLPGFEPNFFRGAQDPHAVLVVHNTQDQKSYGYLLSGCVGPNQISTNDTYIKVIQLDIQAILDMAPAGVAPDATHRLEPGSGKADDPIKAGFLKTRAWGGPCPEVSTGR